MLHTCPRWLEPASLNADVLLPLSHWGFQAGNGWRRLDVAVCLDLLDTEKMKVGMSRAGRVE